jgi:hypothetical protein
MSKKKKQYTREKCMNLLRKRKEKKKVVFQLGDRATGPMLQA